jgi:hypothetical protein
MGRIFLERDNIPFAMFIKAGTEENPTADFFSFSLNEKINNHMYADLYQMVVACEAINYVGYFDGAIHFHLLPKPPLTVDEFNKAVDGIAKDIAELFIRSDTKDPRQLFASAQDKLNLRNQVVEDLVTPLHLLQKRNNKYSI